MPQVWVSLGSNQERERHLCLAVAALRQQYGTLCISSVYESPALGFVGANFYNLVVGFVTEATPQQLTDNLRIIEDSLGRVRGIDKFCPRSIDLDLLTWGDLVTNQPRLVLPRADIVQYAFVLRPLAEVAGTELHPILGNTYQTLWANFAKDSQPIWPVALHL